MRNTPPKFVSYLTECTRYFHYDYVMKGIVVCCDGEKSIKKVLPHTKFEEKKLSRKETIISFIAKFLLSKPDVKVYNERG